MPLHPIRCLAAFIQSPRLLFAAVFLTAASSGAAAEPLTVEVRETAGIARFGYPVTGAFRCPEAGAESFRLLRDGRPVEAQFSRIRNSADGAQWEVDFNLDLLPFETRSFRIEAQDAAPAESPATRGLSLQRNAGTILIRRPGLDFIAPENLFQLLGAVKSPEHDYFVSGSAGFFTRDRQGALRQVELVQAPKHAEVEVLKSGALCAALQLSGEMDLGGDERAKTTLRLDFPRSKSWVRAEWKVDDPRQAIASVGVKFQMRLKPAPGRPTLVDFGAPSSVYAALQPSQLAVFQASPRGLANADAASTDRTAPWEVTRGTVERMIPYVAGLENDARPVEGWAHVMDDRRCTAIAVDRFARETTDRIEASAEGRVEIWRDYAKSPETKSPATKTLVFWLHFVPSPPHVGAVTSPQSMQSPPEVRITAVR